MMNGNPAPVDRPLPPEVLASEPAREAAHAARARRIGEFFDEMPDHARHDVGGYIRDGYMAEIDRVRAGGLRPRGLEQMPPLIRREIEGELTDRKTAERAAAGRARRQDIAMWRSGSIGASRDMSIKHGGRSEFFRAPDGSTLRPGMAGFEEAVAAFEEKTGRKYSPVLKRRHARMMQGAPDQSAGAPLSPPPPTGAPAPPSPSPSPTRPDGPGRGMKGDPSGSVRFMIDDIRSAIQGQRTETDALLDRILGMGDQGGAKASTM